MERTKISTQTTHRPAIWADIPAIVDLCNDVMVAMWGVAEWSVADTEADFSRPDFVLEEAIHLWHDTEGRLVGMARRGLLFAPPVRNLVMPYILPAFPNPLPLGLEMLAWGEAELQRLAIPVAPQDAKVEMFAWTSTTYAPYRELYQAYGMELTRQYWTMAIALDRPLPRPTLPDGVVIRPMRYPEENQAMYRMSDIAFAEHHGHISDPEMQNYDSWTHRFESQWFDPTLWFVAEVNGEIAAFSWCRAGASDDPRLGFIETLGVLPQFRRRGLATLLLQHSFRELYERGMERAELEVDATNTTGATRVYAAVGMKAKVVWDSYDKVLRDGIELAQS